MTSAGLLSAKTGNKTMARLALIVAGLVENVQHRVKAQMEQSVTALTPVHAAQEEATATPTVNVQAL